MEQQLQYYENYNQQYNKPKKPKMLINGNKVCIRWVHYIFFLKNVYRSHHSRRVLRMYTHNYTHKRYEMQPVHIQQLESTHKQY